MNATVKTGSKETEKSAQTLMSAIAKMTAMNMPTAQIPSGLTHVNAQLGSKEMEKAAQTSTSAKVKMIVMTMPTAQIL